ncbi:hypothetical protein [Streptomyces sp. MMS24-I29]|uniref:hypothetical protein n=1 Tax=Streptomyces sp. MMS24-I29 TaxID=3351480 RepID=UPI003C7C5752
MVTATPTATFPATRAPAPNRRGHRRLLTVSHPSPEPWPLLPDLVPGGPRRAFR